MSDSDHYRLERMLEMSDLLLKAIEEEGITTDSL